MWIRGLYQHQVSWIAAAMCSFSILACSGEADDAGPTPLGGSNTEPGPGPEPAPTLACPAGKVKVDATSLAFDGVDDYVSMGQAASLGLSRFTIEAWVRRDGAGTRVSTGVGGLALVPIVGKGRGEDDGSVVDCNYVLGFSGDVLGADFEDLETGANHPVTGRTKIGFGTWHHVAASYDGATWKLYVDGRLDGESRADATPRHDSRQHFAIASALDSKGVPAGFLKGGVDEVRMWNRARSEGEISSAMYRRIDAESGLLGRWARGQKDRVIDSAGENDGAIQGGAVFVNQGAILDLGLPPKLRDELPLTGDAVTGATTRLRVQVDDPDSQEFTATFHVRPIGNGDDFTVVVLPDTQYYTRWFDNPNYYYDQTKWIMDNAAAYNIVGVIHNGDIVDNGNSDSQWTIADRAMKTLETTSARFPEGMPFGTCAGNHDQSPIGVVNSTTKYNAHYGVARFGNRTYFGGTYAANKVDENWFTFAAGGLDFVVVDLQFSSKAREAPVLAWTRSVFQQHPDAFGILNSHFILDGDGRFGAAGQSMYDAVKDIDNVQLLTCGHIGAEKARTDTFQGNAIHSMLADYQFRRRGGYGMLRIWEFSPVNDELTVRSYSPTEKSFETDADSEFTLKVDLSGSSNSAFKPLAVVDPANRTNVEATLEGLAPGQTYEWYVTISDCAHTVASPLYRFKTK